MGARTLAQFEDNLGALDVQLSQDDQRRLDEASAVPLGFPHDFMRLPVPRNNIFGGTQVRVSAASRG